MDVYQQNSHCTRMKVALTSFLILFGTYIFAQDVDVRHLRATSKGKIIFHYMIKPGQNPIETYSVQIFTSMDGYKQPLAIEVNNIQAGKIQTVAFLAKDHFRSISESFKVKVIATAAGLPSQMVSNEAELTPEPNLGLEAKSLGMLLLGVMGLFGAVEGARTRLRIPRLSIPSHS